MLSRRPTRMSLILLLVAVIALSQVQAQYLPLPKLGQCPLPSPGVCAAICLHDFQCPGSLKCCSTSCGGRVCRPPLNCPLNCPPGFHCLFAQSCPFCPVRPQCVPDKGRPGQCPAPSGLPGICIFDPRINCLRDSQCPIGRKCCPEGCGSVCKPVVTFPFPFPVAAASLLLAGAD